MNNDLENIAKEIVKNYFGNFNLHIAEKIDRIQFKKAELNKSSHFDYDNDIVYINVNYTDDVNHYVHELFHAVSTNHIMRRTLIGFNKKYYKKIDKDINLEISYGYALNEGATHSYTRDATNGKYGEINPISSYNFCANIFKNLENLVPASIIKILYANGNVDGLANIFETNCKTEKENVLKLILSMDAYFDTYRIYSAFMQNPEAEDVKSLLFNAYTYLAKIVSDKKKAEGKKFSFFEDIKTDHLSLNELKIFKQLGSKVNVSNVKPSKLITHKEFEKMAVYLYTLQLQKQLKNFSMIPDTMKNAEFYNFLLLNCYYNDLNKIRENLKTSDDKSILTKKIFDETKNAFLIDENLPRNIRTILSTRYAVRAGVATSDFYMLKSINNKQFREYLKNSDIDYFETLDKMSKHDQNFELEK